MPEEIIVCTPKLLPHELDDPIVAAQRASGEAVRLSAEDVLDRCRADSKLSSQSSAASPLRVQGADQFRVIVCQLAETGTSLSRHVFHVVFMGSERQVLDVDAGRIVAGVKQEEIIRNRAVRQFPGDPMGSQESLAFLNDSVAVLVGSSRPQQAATFIRGAFAEFGRESRSERLSSAATLELTLPTAVSTSADPHAARKRLE